MRKWKSKSFNNKMILIMSKAKVAKSKLFNTFQQILENALKAFYYFKTSNSKGNRMSTSVERKGN
jgi:hypothetical protein